MQRSSNPDLDSVDQMLKDSADVSRKRKDSAYAAWLNELEPHKFSDHPDAMACLNGTCTETITSKQHRRAVRVAAWTIHTGEWPRMSEVGLLAAEHDDLKTAIKSCMMFIKQETDPMLRTDPGNATLREMRAKWITLWPDFEGAITQMGSRSHVFYECLQAVSKVHEWKLACAVTPCDFPLPEPKEPNRLIIKQV